MADGEIKTYGAIRSMTGDGKAAFAGQIWDEEQQKFQSEINRETANDGLVSAKTTQTFTGDEKAIARNNIGAGTYTKPSDGIPTEDLDEGAQGSLEKAKTALQEQDIEDYAKKDGYYAGMVVGSAENLAGQEEVTNGSMFRKSGGTEDIGSGIATIESIQGETVVWNQLMNISTISTTFKGLAITKGPDGYLKIQGTPTAPGSTAILSGMEALRGHTCLIGTSIPLPEGFSWSDNYNRDRRGFFIVALSATFDGNFSLYVGTTEIDFEGYYQIFDLTLIYGAGNEPTTVAQFEADYFRWFGKPLTYEEYNAGELIPTKVSALKTVGFNQWDEELFMSAGFTKVANGYQSRVNNTFVIGRDIPFVFLPNTSYVIHQKGTRTGGTPYARVYYTDGTSETSTLALGVSSSFFVTASNKTISRISFTYGSGGDQTYILEEFSIGIAGTRNGEYEPYWSEETPIDVTTLKGKLNGEGESVVVFPYGMKIADYAGTVRDSIEGKKAVQRVYGLNLGSIPWIDDNGRWRSRYGQTTIKDNTTHFISILGEKLVIQNGRYIYVTDSSYADADAFKAAMQGVILFCELDTPIEYVLDDFSLPLRYKVDDFGTEEQIPVEGEKSVPALINVKYAVNAVDTLRNLPKNYISAESMDNFLAALGAQMGGTWTKTFNTTTNRYDFTFTPNASTNAENV